MIEKGGDISLRGWFIVFTKEQKEIDGEMGIPLVELVLVS